MPVRDPGAVLRSASDLFQKGRLHDARRILRRLLDKDPHATGALQLAGIVASELGTHDQAVRYLARARDLSPSSAGAHLNLGKALQAAGRLDEALAAFASALRLRPDNPDIHIACGGAATGAERRSGASYTPMTPFCTWEVQRSKVTRDRRAFLSPLKVRAASRIRLACVSADFRNHAVAKLATRLLESHDRSGFEVVGIALRKDDGSEFSRGVRLACDVFLDAHSLTGVEPIAQMMRDNEVDIAVDLMGHTAHSRWGAFARRAAPIQVNFLGYPGTTGIPNMDYVVVDPFIAGGSLRTVATEKLVIMPDCYQCNDSRRAPVGDPPLRSACGLPETSFVFASFNAQHKITPDVFAVWMRILKRVEASVLWLFVGLEGAAGETAKANLRREAASRGVDPARLVFGGRLPDNQHMTRLALTDLHLDTFPYTSHTTGSDALWAGCPILTRVGQSFASRVCGSLLTTIGVPELITTSAEDYEELAVRLACDKAMLAGLRERIVDGRARSPLFDTQRFCRNLERAYTEMVERSRAGMPPAEIDVRTLN